MSKIEVYVPNEIAEFAPWLQHFVQTQVMKLHANRHKGNGEVEFVQLLQMLDGEVKEMKEALDEKSQFDVQLEAVDVANFSFLIGMRAMTRDKAEFEHERSYL